MTTRKFITFILVLTSILSGFAAASIKDSADWWVITKPFFGVWFLSTVLALLINNFNYVRRIMYPTFVCLSAWTYKHKILMTKFTQDTYRVYKMNKKSFKNLFAYTQTLFDAYVAGLENS